ncbi:MAG TPA: DUF4956 domain-containing protein, partial [Clostridiales bacterium]|nr:DUF4956 domain-containing protein [Clostridiales bacterium]
VFLALGGGFACGRGYITYGIFFVILICVVLILLTRFGYGTRRCEERQLRIKIPEDLNYADAFNDILEKYTKSYKLERIKSIDLGALFELTYHVILKNDTDLHAFIDELRCRNGNLTIALTVLEENAGFQV